MPGTPDMPLIGYASDLFGEIAAAGTRPKRDPFVLVGAALALAARADPWIAVSGALLAVHGARGLAAQRGGRRRGGFEPPATAEWVTAGGSREASSLQSLPTRPQAGCLWPPRANAPSTAPSRSRSRNERPDACATRTAPLANRGCLVAASFQLAASAQPGHKQDACDHLGANSNQEHPWAPERPRPIPPIGSRGRADRERRAKRHPSSCPSVERATAAFWAYVGCCSSIAASEASRSYRDTPR